MSLPHAILSDIPGSEEVKERVLLQVCERILESEPMWVLPYPEPELTDPELRRWGLFALFLERECGSAPEDAGYHVDWVLRRDFKTPEEWLGEEGVRFRRSQNMREHDVGVLKAWSDFEAKVAA